MRRLLLFVLLALFAGSAEARPLKGGMPRSVAVGYGGAWVGFGDGRVTRVDARNGERRTTRLGVPSVLSLAMGFGSVWAAPGIKPLYRLRPSGAVAATISRRGRWLVSTIAVGAGFVWAVDQFEHAVYRVDPRTNRITGRKVIPHTLHRFAAGRQGVWVETIPGRAPYRGPEGARIVSRLDSKTLRLHRAFRLTCDASLQPAGRSLWVLDNCTGTLRRFDAGRGVLGPSVETAPGSLGLTVGFGSVWVSNGSTVRRIDPGRRAVIARIRAEGPFLAAGEGFVWVLDWGGGGWLRRIDPATNRLAGHPIRLASG